ncbi:MAG: RsmE family RNA methyltransferase [Bacilli bacterium]|nr:RsmE family RNA methyltransferase [Bacilli bacterium]
MQRYFGKEKKENVFTLEENDLYHIGTVMRMEKGDQIEVVYDNKFYICSLEGEKGSFTALILKEEEGHQETKQLILLTPLLKEQKMDFILQKATELGVSTIIPYEAERSIIKIDSKKAKSKRERWMKICKEAAEQSKRTSIPTVEEIHTLKELKNLEGLKILCSTSEKQKTFKSLLQTSTNCDKISMIMGPEGGFSLKEEELLKQMDFIPVTLGTRIMRAETVPLFLLSAIQYENME